MEFNKDELEAPAWMDLGFFEKVMKHVESDQSTKVHQFSISPGSKAGDHFASIMFRVNIQYSSKSIPQSEISVILKTVPAEDGLKKDLLADGNLFGTETKMYTTIVPEMHRLLRLADDDTELGAKLLYHSKEPAHLVIFEDLTKRGYVMKGGLLDFEDSKLVLRKLAKWHATSMFMENDMPEIKDIKIGVFNFEMKDFIGFWKTSLDTLSEVIKTWPGYEMYSEKIMIIRESIFDRASEIYTAKKSDLIQVLNHGDFHYKNMMFTKNADGMIIDPMLVDFQVCVWATPAVDLLYLLYMAVSADARENHRDEIIKFYHDEFTATLKKIGYMKKYPTLHELQIEILKCGQLEIIMACVFLPFILFDIGQWTTEELKMDLLSFDGMAEMNRKAYANPVYLAIVKNCLPIFLHKGFFG